jgi:rhodanese-related sulfurtransferase
VPERIVVDVREAFHPQRATEAVRLPLGLLLADPAILSPNLRYAVMGQVERDAAFAARVLRERGLDVTALGNIE